MATVAEAIRAKLDKPKLDEAVRERMAQQQIVAMQPFMDRHPARSQEDINQADDFFKGQAAGFAGLPADLLQMGASVQSAARGMPVPDLPLTSEKIGQAFGADTESSGFGAGLFGAPDPGDIARIGGKGLLAQALFHGTPHKFDRFDISRIGTGEGAQAYGHGLYFAESPGVAKSYQADLAPGRGLTTADMQKLEPGMSAGQPGWQLYDKETGYLDTDFGPFKTEQEALDFIANPSVEGHLYEVDIPDETIDKMLDWDAPLSEQPESVRRVIETSDKDELKGWVNWFDREELAPVKWDDLTEQQQKVFARSLEKDGVQLPRTLENKFSPPHPNTPEQTGEDFYRHFSDNPEEASETLKQAGIPGIRYFDGQSRSTGEGTRNIVVFNPDDIREVKRDGEVVFKNVTRK